MVSGVFTIPLQINGLSPSQLGDTQSPWQLREYIGARENALCQVAAKSLLREPARYNPLVFHGPAATGKSLLTRGLAANWKQHASKAAKAIVTTGPELAREYGDATETDSLGDFRTKYRRAGLLAIDDLDQIGEKAAVQEEIVRTLDTLLERGHPVIVSLSHAPGECPSLSQNLASRLASGLTVPLVPPGPAARQRILYRLAELHGLRLPDPVTSWIADGPLDHLTSLTTVPDLNNLVLQLAVATRLDPAPIDLQLVQHLITAHGSPRKTPLKSITRLVCKYFQLRTAELKGPARQQRVVRARGVAMLLARQLTGESLEQVGRHFGNRDHTTVLHACRKTESLIASDVAIRQAMEDLLTQLSTT